MNIFILSTGRCGSLTFTKACSHITNFSAGHESREKFFSKSFKPYPSNHIESDNRLTWFLGALDELYGNSAFYVHLTRDREATARSLVKRYERNTMLMYHSVMLTNKISRKYEPFEVCLDYVDTVNSNISCFLKDKQNKMIFRLNEAKSDFDTFWNAIGAQGDINVALCEWEVAHNASDSKISTVDPVSRILWKAARIVKGLPGYIKKA